MILLKNLEMSSRVQLKANLSLSRSRTLRKTPRSGIKISFSVSTRRLSVKTRSSTSLKLPSLIMKSQNLMMDLRMESTSSVLHARTPRSVTSRKLLQQQVLPQLWKACLLNTNSLSAETQTNDLSNILFQELNQFTKTYR